MNEHPYSESNPYRVSTKWYDVHTRTVIWTFYTKHVHTYIHSHCTTKYVYPRDDPRQILRAILEIFSWSHLGPLLFSENSPFEEEEPLDDSFWRRLVSISAWFHSTKLAPYNLNFKQVRNRRTTVYLGIVISICYKHILWQCWTSFILLCAEEVAGISSSSKSFSWPQFNQTLSAF